MYMSLKGGEADILEGLEEELLKEVREKRKSEVEIIF